MTEEQCARCRFAPAPGSYSTCTGDDLPVWSCDMIDDPRMPFDMEDDTVCPCFEEAPVDDDSCPACEDGILIRYKIIDYSVTTEGLRAVWFSRCCDCGHNDLLVDEYIWKSTRKERRIFDEEGDDEE